MSIDLKEKARAARLASRPLSALPQERRNAALLEIEAALRANQQRIFEANERDMARAKETDLPLPMQKRLRFNEAKLEEVCQGLRDLAALPDPLGRTTLLRELSPGLVLRRRTCPIGVIGVIFESRPDALVQILSLCLKTGNAVLLKGGTEAQETNSALFETIVKGTDLPEGWCALLRGREEVTQMLALYEDIDLIIPRGSNAFVRMIMENTQIPVLGHSSGICHLYLDASAEPDMAARLAVDAKTQYPAACNAIETLLIHSKAAEAAGAALAALNAAGVVLHADSRTAGMLEGMGISYVPLKQEDLGREYGDLELNVVMVDALEEAIEHINAYGSHHTDAIVTDDPDSAEKFKLLVDSAGVYHNCSTRFADGQRYGFGAEVGISTGKLHARGPMGPEGLCTYKYEIEGQGQTVEDFAEGRLQYTHITMEEA